MSIEITIIYSPENVLITQASYTFPDEGGTLGRANNNFWVLEDPNKYMSSVHAKIACQSGQYFLTDTSTNGTFINGASEPVGNGNQVLLNDGDHFTISDYEFVAHLGNALDLDSFPATASNAPFTAVNSDPFANLASNNDDVFAKHDAFPENSHEESFSNFSSITNNNDPFAPATHSLNADHIMPSIQTDIQNDPLELLSKAETLNNNPFSTTNDSSDIFTSNNFQQNNVNESSPNENSGVMNDAIDWPVASPESRLIPDDWDDFGDDLDFTNNKPVALPVEDLSANFAPVQSGNSFHNEKAITDDIFSQQPLGQENNANFASLNTPFESDFTNTNHFSGSPSLNESNTPFSSAQSFPSEQPKQTSTQQINHIDTFNATETNSSIQETVNHANIVVPEVNSRTESEYKQLDLQNQQLRNQVAELQIQLASAQQVKTASSNTVNADVTLNTVVDAMGLAKWNLPDSKKIEINETVGLLMRETMQGMMQVLKFRKKIKEEFRINVTTIQSVENNPLKFSANIDDALENMFIKENNAYKKPVDAVKEGFQGIAEHQVAVVAGMQAAFRGMIERFDPAHLESRFEKYNSTSLLRLGKKTKQWNAYKEYHQGLVENLDDSFQHLFGYDFVQAYEEQMNSLISARVTANIENKNTN